MLSCTVRFHSKMKRLPGKHDLISKFGLLDHPEGGYYNETFRSSIQLSLCAEPESKVKVASTAIYFLIDEDNVSRFHRIKSDEGRQYINKIADL